MNELLFRIIDNDKIIGLLDLTNYDQHLITITKKMTYEQYTGFKDKNKRLVFDGDICKDMWERELQVFFDEEHGTWRFKPLKITNFETADMWEWFMHVTDIEVIGNIHVVKI